METLEVPLLSRSPTLPPGLTDLHRSQGQLHFESREDKLHSHNNAVLHARPGTASSTNYILYFSFCKLPVLVSIFFLRKRTKSHNQCSQPFVFSASLTKLWIKSFIKFLKLLKLYKAFHCIKEKVVWLQFLQEVTVQIQGVLIFTPISPCSLQHCSE